MEVMAQAVKSEFEAVRRNRIYEEIARQIEKMIAEKMKPGDKLPPERQLADMFGVSRSSIRDAIRTLELSGLVEARQGLGTVVRERSAEAAVNTVTQVLVQKRKMVSELLDVRKMIEPPLAARAAVHATSDEVTEMDNILRRQEEKMRGGELAIDEDSDFHYAIALAADNSVVLKVLDVLMDLLRDTRERSLQVAGRPERSMAGHREIFDAIKRQDPAGAEAAMCRHIESVEQIVLTKF
jgi:GntR family transcriptional repressor for pyruvate dehydrogenase complex